MGAIKIRLQWIIISQSKTDVNYGEFSGLYRASDEKEKKRDLYASKDSFENRLELSEVDEGRLSEGSFNLAELAESNAIEKAYDGTKCYVQRRSKIPEEFEIQNGIRSKSS